MLPVAQRLAARAASRVQRRCLRLGAAGRGVPAEWALSGGSAVLLRRGAGVLRGQQGPRRASRGRVDGGPGGAGNGTARGQPANRGDGGSHLLRVSRNTAAVSV